jgi:alpha/beta hydrolase family protein
MKHFLGSSRSIHFRITLASSLVAAVFAAPAEARITSIVIDCARSQSPTFCPGQSPTFGGTSFGNVGQYEKLRGTAFGELDQLNPRNAVITDIEFVPAANRNPATSTGKVKYSMDIFILKPINLGSGNHRVLLDFNNRGEMRLARLNEFSLDNPPLTNDPSTAVDAGTGFVMKQGYTVVGNGWDVGATPGSATGGGMTISVPPAKNPDGTSITGPSYEYIVFDNATTMTATLTYPAATLDKSKAVLTVRTHVNDAPVLLQDTQWEYTSAAGTAIRLLPAGTRFAQSAIYDFSYTAKDPVVAAVGLAATRDFVSFLRHGTAAQGNPLAGNVRHTFSYSISQPSRTLNDLVYFGFNEDEDGRRVLDGILSHTGGGSGDQINYRFAQPGRTERNRQNHLYPEGVFPFAHETLTDHLSGKTDGRDVRCTLSNTCPKRFEVNTANEYWVKAGSLLHSDTRGKDLKDPEDVRYYLISGLSHGVGNAATKSTCQQFLNPTNPYRAHRALLVALDQWVSDGTKPPKSRVPEGGHRAFAVPIPGVQTGFVPQRELGWPNIPGVTYTGVITTRYFLDFGPDFANGILSNYPPSLAGRPAYPIFVSKVDHDGNEIAGVRLPPVEAPIATTTGWALRAAAFGGNDGCEANGQNIPFQTTKAQRELLGDPRKSLEERYKNHAGYVKEVSKAAEKLEKDGFLLAEDVQRYIDEAEASNVLK